MLDRDDGRPSLSVNRIKCDIAWQMAKFLDVCDDVAGRVLYIPTVAIPKSEGGAYAEIQFRRQRDDI